MIKNVISDSLSQKSKFCLIFIIFIIVNIFSSENILILRPIKIEYKAIESGLKHYFGDNYNILPLVNCNTAACLTQNIKNETPVAIVAMGEDMIYSLKKNLPSSAQNIPIFSVMKSYSPSQRYKIKNSYTLNYETPFIVYINKLKKDLKVSINRVGVIHSNRFSSFKVDEFINSSKEKSIQVLSKMIITTDKNRNIDNDIDAAFTTLCNENKVNAILLLDDNSLLTKDLIEKCWNPLSSAYNVPIIVPSKTYLSEPSNFGTIAINANLKVTGKQLGSSINNVLNNKIEKKNQMSITYVSYVKNILGKVNRSDISYGRIIPFSKPLAIEVVEETNAQELTDSIKEQSDLEEEKDILEIPEVKKNTETTTQQIVKKKPKKKKSEKTAFPKPNIPSFSGKYIKITVNANQVFQNNNGQISYIGTVKNGEIFPVLEELPETYKIQFFSHVGFIDKLSGEIIETGNQNQLIYGNPTYLISGAILIIIIILVIIILVTKKKKIVIPKHKSCLIITSSKKKIKLDDISKKKISLKKAFHKLGYHVEITNDLTHVNKVLLYYMPDVICIDWRFTINIRQIIYNMLSERSFTTDVSIIFYNTVNAKTISAKNKFTDSTFYFDNDITMENIEKTIYPTDTKNSYKSLEGKIEKNNLVEIIQLIDNSKKTGSVYIEKNNHPYGVIFISNGMIIYCATEVLQAEEAAYHILSLTDGMFHFVEGKLPKQNNMNISVMQTLMSYFKDIDETKLRMLE